MQHLEANHIRSGDGLSEMLVHTCDYCKHITLDLSSAEALERDQVVILANERRAERVASRVGCPIFRFATYSNHAQDSDEEFDDEGQYSGFQLVLRFSRGWQAAPIGAITSYWTKNTDGQLDPSIKSLPQPRTQYAILPAKDDEVASIIKRRLPQRDVASPANLHRLREWIQKCNNNHRCRRHGDKLWVPTRLIAVSRVDGHLSARVLNTAGTKKVEYAVLSYVWGRTGALHQYLQKHSSKIETSGEVPLEDLPQTIQDAMHITHSLGLEYLWVDCLCILQNDDQDKTREIGFMAKIFESAYIALLAASSGSSDKGFLQIRDLDKDLQRCTQIKVQLPKKKVSYANLLTPEFSYAPKQEPLSRRAWTLQESLLTVRKIVFNSWTVSWSCQELTRDEGWNLWQETRQGNIKSTAKGQEGVGAILASGFFEQALASMTTSASDPTSQTVTDRNIWEAIVIEYTNRDLFEVTDRPAAISGIAEQLGRGSRDTYLAGLWRSHLPQALFWQTHPSDSSISKGFEHVRLPGPTWSWMTVDARVRLVFHTSYLDNIETLVKIMDARVEPLSIDAPYSTIKSGSIRLEGYLEDMYYIVFTQQHQWYDLDGNARDVDFNLDFLTSDIRNVKRGVTIPIPEEPTPEQNGDVDEQQYFEDSDSADSSVPIPDDSRTLAQSNGIKVCLLYLFACRSKEKDQSFFDGLVILPTEGGQYRRIGTFTNRFFPTYDRVPYRPVDSLNLREVELV